MIRYLILFFNMLGLLVYHLFLPDVITATQVVPSSVKPGDSFTVEVTINKGTVSSFAKLQEDLPNGFTASEVDSKGGSFSFKDHSVKFIWTALPSDNSFVVKYKITVDPSANGQQSFGGKFSYVIDNNRQSVEIASSSITVGNNNQPVAATSTDNSTNQTASTTATSTDNSTNQTASTTPTSTDNSTNQTASTTPTSTDNSTNQTASTTPASTDNSTNQTASTTPASTDNSTNQTASTTPTSTDNTTNTQSSTTNNSDGVSAVRIVPSGNISGSFTVSVTINRSNVSGFAKFEDDLPIGFTATAIDKDGASFSFADQKVKFIWLSLPNDAVIKVSYNVTVDNTISGNQTITGLFAYVKDSTRKVMLAPSTVNISSGSNQPMASNNGSVNSSTPNTTNSNSVQPNNTINSSGSNQVANNSSTTNNTS
ncbi:MAG TPA: hypothetical protein VNG53_03440, partial [Bacteroidia bacterium]|nr:hypothetical protein [Bacteroidia bacterium]